MLLNTPCLPALKGMEDNTVDAVITDPPYGLAFMGRHWDYGLPDPEIWRECYRVLKPGAFLVAMASPRTYHRLACDIEDAGFIVHNAVTWIYGQGFPKGTDVSKAIDREAVMEWLEGKDHGLTPAEVRKVVSAAVNGEYENPRAAVESTGGKLSEVIHTGGNRKAGARLIALLESRYGEMPKRVRTGSRSYKYHDSEGWGNPKNISKQWYLEPDRERDIDLAALPITACASPESQLWDGHKYGLQSLKPAMEVIGVFQKPYEGKPLDSIRKWRVGTFAIDRARIQVTSQDREAVKGSTKGPSQNIKLANHNFEPVEYNSLGRYPANLILSHNPDCKVRGVKQVISGDGKDWSKEKEHGDGHTYLGTKPTGQHYGLETITDWECTEGCAVKALGEQSGDVGDHGTNIRGLTGGGIIFPGAGLSTDANRHNDPHGTAARFFNHALYSNADYMPFYYEGKASPKERNLGVYYESEYLCEVWKARERKGLIGCHIRHRKARDGKPAYFYICNEHVSVKPVELMRWLVKLFKGNSERPLIVDPFAGSGTTAIAAIMEKCDWVAIEREPEYCAIIKNRTDFWTAHTELYLTQECLF